MKNILILSAGRRVSLVRAFKQTASEFSKDIKVFTVDKDPSLASACHLSDGSFKIRPITSANYIDDLLNLCKDQNIGIVIPTIDTCLPILAEYRQHFEDNGINVIVSSPELVSICSDKRKTFNFFVDNSVHCPELIDINNPRFPMFAKPYNGSSSIGLYTIKSKDDISESIKNNTNLMFMEYIDKNNYCEYTVDMYYDRNNVVKCIVPRKRIEVRGGEVSKAITNKNYIIGFLKKRFEKLNGAVGCVCFQLFYRKNDNDILGIEINPRFGGGYPLSYFAGANFPQMIMQEYLLGNSLEYTDNWQDNKLMLRYDAEIII